MPKMLREQSRQLESFGFAMTDLTKSNGKGLAAVVSLGCVKNLVDSETLAPQLVGLGYEMTSDLSEATVIVVNTCGFLESAVSEAVGYVLEAARYKAEGLCKYLVVTGCMVQRYGKKLIELLPEVDLFLGTSHYHRLGSALSAVEDGGGERVLIGRPVEMIGSATARARSTPWYAAYVKIAEGCGNHCSFCMIPRLRGPYRSRSVEDVENEVVRLRDEGVVEINLIAQDITAFGSDRGESGALSRLLARLELIDGIEWIRLLYAYPKRVDASLLQVMADSRKIAPYLDIPFQHCVPGILSAMHRDETVPSVDAVVELIRSYVPGIALRTSLMVGFPGESDADFNELVRFVVRTEFDHVGVFAYSAEAGARAAKLPGQVADEIKEERRLRLLEAQRGISRKRLRGLIGRVMPILVEGTHPETELLLIGRLAIQAPEVDGSVIITRGIGQTGSIVDGRITAAHDYDVEAELEW